MFSGSFRAQEPLEGRLMYSVSRKSHTQYVLLFTILIWSFVCVLTNTYFALICKARKSETQGGPLRKYTSMYRNKHTHTDSSLVLRSASMPVRMALTRRRHGAHWLLPPCPAHPLTLDRWTRLLLFFSPPLPSFMGPLIMLTCHIKIKLSM